MRTRSLERWTRVAGVALLVMAGFSAGLQHAHPGGLDVHEHHNQGHHGPSRLGEESGPVDAWFAAPLHRHIFLLGFQFTLPADNDSPEEPTGGDQMLAVRLLGDQATDSSARLPGVQGVLPDVSSLAAVAARLTAPVARIVQPQESSTLCDTARHERSGVQRT